MPVIDSDYQCRMLYRNGHVQTIHPRVFSRRPDIRPREILMKTPDNDQLELYLNDQDNNRSLVIITHGLESHGKEAVLLELAQTFEPAGVRHADLEHALLRKRIE